MGSGSPLLQVVGQHVDHETGKGFSFHKGGQLGLTMKGIRNLNGQTLHRGYAVGLEGEQS